MSSDATAEIRSTIPRLEAHQSFLVYRRFLYLKWATLLIGLSALAYVVDTPRTVPSGSTWLGYTLGTIGAGIICWLTWFGWRKRSYGAANAPLAAWLSAHVYFGLSLVVVATLHTGFRFGWNIHTLAYALMILVIASGVFGIFAYVRYPRLITLNRLGATRIQMLSQLASIDGEIRQAILGMPDAVVKLVAPAIERDAVGGSVWRQLSGRYPECPTAAALRGMQTLPSDLQSDEARGILVLLTRKAELLTRARRDIQYKGLMDIWLYIHVPLTFALLAALAAHIISVFFYW
jgi:hypothetical protein